MANPVNISVVNNDPNASGRKKDHIELAFKSKVDAVSIDPRFYYEPLLTPHPVDTKSLHLSFLGKILKAPIWVSSMTGGTEIAKTINYNLARVCGDFGLGMGLGSCRQLLYSDEFIKDFQIRKYINDQPLYANLGIAQIEELIDRGETSKIKELLNKLETDGLIIHVNPMQEWLQPEGDRFKYSPIDTISKILDMADYKIIVKEVGQGMGVKSLHSLLSLPIEALDFGANGGTNFALLEILRSSGPAAESYKNLANIGHGADEMVDMVNDLVSNKDGDYACQQVIISGGVTDFLDGYYLTSKCSLPAIYGQASSFLKHAMGDYEKLFEYVDLQVNGLSLASSFLTKK